MTDLNTFLTMLTRATILHEVGPAVGIGGGMTRVELVEQGKPWKLAAVFSAEGSLVSIGTWVPTRELRPIPGKEITRQVLPEYTLIEEEPAGYNTVGFTWLETRCVGKCPHPYRIDPHHPNYAEVKESLDRGDRSALFCYHKAAR